MAWWPARASAATDPVQAVEDAYERGETDEFIKPVVLQEDGQPVGRIADGDGIIFFNFRADRARELCRAFTEPSSAVFAVSNRPQNPATWSPSPTTSMTSACPSPSRP